MTHVPDAHSSGTPEANTTPDTLCSGNINTKTTTGDSDLSDAECLDDSDVECTPDVVTFPNTISSADIGADTQAADVAITGSVPRDNDFVKSAHVMTHVPDAPSSGTPETDTTSDTVCSGNHNTKTTTDTISSEDICAYTPANVNAHQTADTDTTSAAIRLFGSDGSDDTVTEASADGIAPAGSDGSNSIDTDTIPGSVGADPYHVEQFIGILNGVQKGMQLSIFNISKILIQ